MSNRDKLSEEKHQLSTGDNRGEWIRAQASDFTALGPNLGPATY